jgi:tetratricopeptide (TPR) repeat protein
VNAHEFDKVQYWWENHKDNKEYLGDYDGYCEVLKRMKQRPIKSNSLSEFIGSLSKTIDSDPNALHSMCLRAGFLAMMGDLTAANDLLDRVRTLKSDYYWLYVWEAALKIKQGDLDSAIRSVNSAFEKSPTSDVEGNVRFWTVFDPIKDSPKVAWPSKAKQDAAQGVP